MSVSFSPMPANLMGLPVTARTEMAAPPRVSPSSLVRITPSMPSSLVEGLGDGHGVLAGHRVHHQQDLLGLHRLAHVAQLLHQLFINVQAAGGIDDHRITAVIARVLNGFPGDLHRVALAALEHLHADLSAHDLQLLDGSRTVHVARDQQRLLAALS